MSSDYISREEFERFQRFHHEQFNTVGNQLVEIKAKLDNIQPTTPVAPATKDILLKQVDKLFRDLQFLHTEVAKMKAIMEKSSKNGVTEGVK